MYHCPECLTSNPYAHDDKCPRHNRPRTKLDLATLLLEMTIETRKQLIDLRENPVATMAGVEAEAHLNGKIEGLKLAVDIIQQKGA
jgi:hypothetical protein